MPNLDSTSPAQSTDNTHVLAGFESPYFAAIDLGSNSFHMIIVRLNEDNIEVIDREKEMVQIARGITANGEIDEDTQTRATDCLHRFAERLRDIPKAQIRVVGTKTLRAARNTTTFLAAIQKTLGVPVQIISGFEEARLVYAGVANTISNGNNQRLVIDIGGGSTEFIIGRGYSPRMLESLPLGCVSFTKRFLPDNNHITANAVHRAYVAACTELDEIQKNTTTMGWELVYGTSGTVKAIAELLKGRDGGAVISKQGLNDLVDTCTRRGCLPACDLPELRRQVLPAGMVILQAIFDELGLEKIHIADATLKEGLIYDTLGRISDHDMRETTIKGLLSQHKIDTEQANRVKKSALHFWSKTKGSNKLPGVSRRRMLKWAAQLHEIGLGISHSGSHHHGYYLLRHSDLAGFGRYEQYILANLVRSHRKKLSMSRFEGMDTAAILAFTPLIVCLRIAVALHRRRENITPMPELSEHNGSFTLRVNHDWLKQHPMTQSALEQDISYCKNIGINLKLERTG
ncbi:MAG: phosphatase [Alteromonadaceae bacterium]|nr:MAG: phosphatase [Alteromonadaceae bacterium]